MERKERPLADTCPELASNLGAFHSDQALIPPRGSSSPAPAMLSLWFFLTLSGAVCWEIQPLGLNHLFNHIPALSVT